MDGGLTVHFSLASELDGGLALPFRAMPRHTAH